MCAWVRHNFLHLIYPIILWPERLKAAKDEFTAEPSIHKNIIFIFVKEVKSRVSLSVSVTNESSPCAKFALPRKIEPRGKHRKSLRTQKMLQIIALHLKLNWRRKNWIAVNSAKASTQNMPCTLHLREMQEGPTPNWLVDNETGNIARLNSIWPIIGRRHH